MPWRTLRDQGISFRRGELALIAGPSGGGKSTLALQYAVNSGAPGLYVSCDMGPHMTSIKLASVVSGKPNAEMESTPKEKRRELLQRGASHLWIANEQTPTFQDLDELVLAYLEVHGEAPHVFYLDNAVNVAASGDSDWARIKVVADIAHRMAIRYQMAFILMSHTNNTKGNLLYPASKDELKGQIDALPAVILTTAADASQRVMRIARVKDRHGPADPTGKTHSELTFNGAAGILSDPAPRATAWGNNWYQGGQDD